MKIAHVITGLGDGGAEAVLLQLCKTDTEDQHVVVSLMDRGKYGPLLEAAGVPVCCLNMPKGRITPAGVLKLWRVLRRERPDIVQTWMYHADMIGGLVARLAGRTKICWGLHTSTADAAKLGRTTFFIVQQSAWLSRLIPSRVISVSDEGARHHVQLGYAADRMIVVPNGYDVVHFCEDPAARKLLRTDWGVSDDDVVIGMVARFAPVKDHGNLFAALKRLELSGRKFVVALVGSGMTGDNDRLQRLLSGAQLKHRVLLLGPRSDVSRVMNAIDVHALSSLLEGFPNVLAEAMACGVPCVSTNVGDAARIVGDTGWIAPPRDDAALAAALDAALAARADPDAWRVRRDAARARVVGHFSAARMSNAYRAVWRRVLEGAP